MRQLAAEVERKRPVRSLVSHTFSRNPKKPPFLGYLLQVDGLNQKVIVESR